MTEKKTHKEVKNPQVSARYLADYMAGSERARRSIIRKCKFQPIAAIVQHDEAKMAVGKFLRSGLSNIDMLKEKEISLRNSIHDSDFERDVLDHNADYIARVVKVANEIILPDADLMIPGACPVLSIAGVAVPVELQFRLKRKTKTNKIRVGGGALRYAKGKPLNPDIAAWQSSFLMGYLRTTESDEATEPEGKLCLTIDAYSGIVHPAPSDAISRFHNMEAACQTIAERWPNIPAPVGAVL